MTTPDSTQDTPEATATAEAPAATSAPTPAPRPGPRPGPKPGPKPGPHPSAPVLTTLASDPRRHGRVDADGTVWLITADGERVIATWQAGDADAAYEHFGRRYDDLATEVALLERRLASGAGDARKIGAAAAHLIETLPEAHVLGDVDALRARLAVLAEHAGEAAEAARAEREQRRAEQTARKEALAAEAEDLAANSTQWKSAGERFKTILDEWKAISGLDRKTDDLLWKRFSAARESFNRRRGTHFAELDRGRAGVRKAKTELCERAEALAASTDWAATSSAFRNLLTEWKAAGRTTRDIDDALWKRFKAAQDTFFTARNAQSAERDAELTANAEAKEQLLAEAEKIDVSNRKAARAALRAITDKWDELGRAPRERAAELERRLRVVEKKIRDAEESDRPDPEAQARAEQFIARAEQFEKQAAKAEAAGRAKEAEQARASAAQWRDWAQTATQAVSKKR